MRSERAVIFLVGAVQFVNILDFMMVVPLGPDFAEALGIPVSNIGIISGAYTLAAALSGLLGSFVLDRFDRRTALAVAIAGLSVGTAAGGFAQGIGTLVAARCVAGFFGGPATSIALSIITDVVPAERRGRAMGAVMGAFSAASVLGVPAGLALAESAGWRTPFFVVAALALAINLAVFALLPAMRGHLREGREPGAAAAWQGLRAILRRPPAGASLLLTATVMAASFTLIPNFPAWLQGNLGYPREDLGTLYFVGGAFSFFSMRAVGRLVDRYGSVGVGAAATGVLVPLIAYWFFAYDSRLPILALFVLFMAALSSRNVAYNALTAQVPLPSQRARFLSLQSAVQHLASAAGAILSASLLVTTADGALHGIERVATISLLLSALVPLGMAWVAGKLQARAGVQGVE